jgi:hypothetical protein
MRAAPSLRNATGEDVKVCPYRERFLDGHLLASQAGAGRGVWRAPDPRLWQEANAVTAAERQADPSEPLRCSCAATSLRSPDLVGTRWVHRDANQAEFRLDQHQHAAFAMRRSGVRSPSAPPDSPTRAARNSIPTAPAANDRERTEQRAHEPRHRLGWTSRARASQRTAPGIVAAPGRALIQT